MDATITASAATYSKRPSNEREDGNEWYLHQEDEVSPFCPAGFQKEPKNNRTEDPADLEGHERKKGQVHSTEEHTLHVLRPQGAPVARCEADESNRKPH
mmetsp:Transcript_73597/g.170689  ORF Transcript_73597/g.170689 Transcript_73597/m.170689 type:complete len:99 (-) Transcript_73597:1303-1599(-)